MDWRSARTCVPRAPIFGSLAIRWTWRLNHMPEGMFLKSDGFASNLYDPKGDFPLARYCQENSIKYSNDRIPVRLDTFRGLRSRVQEPFGAKC